MKISLKFSTSTKLARGLECSLCGPVQYGGLPASPLRRRGCRYMARFKHSGRVRPEEVLSCIGEHGLFPKVQACMRRRLPELPEIQGVRLLALWRRGRPLGSKRTDGPWLLLWFTPGSGRHTFGPHRHRSEWVWHDHWLVWSCKKPPELKLRKIWANEVCANSMTWSISITSGHREKILTSCGRCGSGGKSCRLAVGGLPVRSHPGHVEVSLSKTPNP